LLVGLSCGFFSRIPISRPSITTEGSRLIV
jgi:hypothetical protein